MLLPVCTNCPAARGVEYCKVTRFTCTHNRGGYVALCLYKVLVSREVCAPGCVWVNEPTNQQTGGGLFDGNGGGGRGEE